MRLDVPVLTTDQLVIRPWALEDLDEAVRLLDGEIYPQEPGVAPGPEARALRERWLQWTVLSYEQLAKLFQPPYGDRAITLRTSGDLVGSVGYTPCFNPFGQVGVGDVPPMGYTAELGLYWAVAPRHRGKGYATAAGRALVEFAFTELSAARIVATTEHDNLASQRVMQKLGMELRRNALPAPPWLQVVGVLGNFGLALTP